MTREELLIRIMSSKVVPTTELHIYCEGKCGDAVSSAFEEMNDPDIRKMAELAVQKGWTYIDKRGAMCPECARKHKAEVLRNGDRK